MARKKQTPLVVSNPEVQPTVPTPERSGNIAQALVPEPEIITPAGKTIAKVAEKDDPAGDPPAPSDELDERINGLYEKLWEVVATELETKPTNALIVGAASAKVLHRLGFEMGQEVVFTDLFGGGPVQ